MNINLHQLVRNVRDYGGLCRKKPIEEVYKSLVSEGQAGPHLPNYGDDAAVIPWKDTFLLLAADGIMTRLLINEPYAAGKASVMVTVNDIYSMGGRPLALVNVLASGDKEHRTKVVEGIRHGCEKLQVSMVGGHLHPDAPSEAPALSVAILGWANKVLHGYTAEAGDDLVFAADLQGKMGCYSVVSWDANSGKNSSALVRRLETLPLIAERGWAHGAKDVSNAGLLGTLAIMMENSDRGAVVQVDAIPHPPELYLSDWVVSFQSFGFILAVPPVFSRDVVDLFRQREIHAAVVGKVTGGKKVILRDVSREEVLFDFETDKITGIVRHKLP